MIGTEHRNLAADGGAGAIGAGTPIRAEDAREYELTVLAGARWPEAEDDTLPPIAGFIASSFNPLVAEVAGRCLRRRPEPAGEAPCAAKEPATTDVAGAIPAPPWHDKPPTRTALVLSSRDWDGVTARAIAEAASGSRRVPPLLFFQSNPNAVLGHIAARWRLAGPVVCLSPPGAAPPPRRDGGPDRPWPDIPDEALAEAHWLLRDGDADEVLLIAAAQADGGDGAGRARAVLVRRTR